jgi:hypothetical protein
MKRSALGLAVGSPVWIPLLMGAKAVRTAQELRAWAGGTITFGGDDAYQARDLDLDVHTAVMIARIKLSMTPEAFEEVVERIERNFQQWFDSLDRSIRRPEHVVFQDPLVFVDRAQPPALGDQPLLARIVISREDQTILLLGNHIYLGGYLLSQFVQIVFCAAVSRDVFEPNRYLPVLTEVMILGFLGWLAVLKPHPATPLFERKEQIRRFYWKQPLGPIQELSDELRLNTLYIVIARHVHAVMTHLGKDRLRVSLPVSFKSESSFNTVGGMMLDIDAAPDVNTLARAIKQQVKQWRWQVPATNHIQRIFPTRTMSETARNLVDLTLTVVPQKTLPKNLLIDAVDSYEFTMDSIHYPVYIMAFLFEDSVHTSVMVNAPSFDCEGFVADTGAVEMDLALVR